MRILLLLRGAPGCGKTTWVEANGLRPYTLSSDDIRLMYQSPVMGIDGQTHISQDNDEAVWKTLFRILRSRMQRGDFTVVDATNARTAELNRYKELCAEYRYRIYCVDFTQIPVGEVKARNAGLSAIPENLSLVATEQMIMGVGQYEESELSAESFRKTSPEDCFQIYGHRNLKQVPLTAKDRVFHLEGQIEYGSSLRCLKIGHDGIQPITVANRVFRTPEEREEQNRFANSSVAELLISMRHNKYIMEKKYGNLSSFNFTDEAFYDKAWNSQTVRARGLYLDTVRGKVAARAYDKFFNIGEREETRMDSLQRRLRFPVTAYVKENGYLGIVSYDENKDDLLVACKFTMDSLFVEWLREMLAAKVSGAKLEELKEYIREHNVSFIFECVDMAHDPHIIEYPENRLVLLDIVENSMEAVRYSYEKLCAVADRFSLTHKEKACEIPDWQTFFDWYYDIRREDYEYRGQKIEGFVIEDSDGYMVKVKLAYYHFWKQMRAVAKEVSKKGFIPNTGMLTTPVANEFYGWLRERYDTGELKKLPKDICSLRRKFLESKCQTGKEA